MNCLDLKTILVTTSVYYCKRCLESNEVEFVCWSRGHYIIFVFINRDRCRCIVHPQKASC